MTIPLLAFAVLVLGCQPQERTEPRGAAANGDVVSALEPVSSPDPDVRAAQDELAKGRAWAATRLVYRAIKGGERRTPEAVLVAARSAAAWGGWELVHALLAYESWLDTRFGGEGRELLARAALERGDAAVAREHAEASLRAEGAGGAIAVRTVLLARALDRLDERDSAAATYRRAAGMLGPVREWLDLRAAGVTQDADARERLYSRLRDSATRARVPWTEALALERFGMHLAAAAEYEKLGDMPSAFRLRLAADDDPGLRPGLVAALLGYIQRDASAEHLTRAIQVLDDATPALDAASELLVARRAAAGGVHARAMQGFARVPAAQLTDGDVLAWARAALAAGQPRQALASLGRRRFATGLAAEALYVRALAQVRSGAATAARATLQGLVAAHGATRFAADGLYLLADLESDAGREARARDLHQRSCAHPQPGGRSDESCFRAGILSFVLGDHRRAAASFDALPRRFPNSPEASAALYWAGRSYRALRDDTAASARFEAVMRREPLSYYAGRAAARLGVPQRLPTAVDSVAPAAVGVVAERAAVLERLGMETEERYEYDALERRAAADPARALEAGAVFLERGQAVRAIRMGWRAVGAARTAADSAARADARGYRLVYPVLHEVELVARARENRLDPALVAAVIRQESSWHPRAVSRAGARGLMQLMPTVGAAIARSKGYPVWDPALLLDPDVSLELGTAHLRAALTEYTDLPRALAAYNAGGSRVTRWARRAGAADPELFVERIPFVETRDYVRIVMRNVEIYRSLYGLRP